MRVFRKGLGKKRLAPSSGNSKMAEQTKSYRVRCLIMREGRLPWSLKSFTVAGTLSYLFFVWCGISPCCSQIERLFFQKFMLAIPLFFVVVFFVCLLFEICVGNAFVLCCCFFSKFVLAIPLFFCFFSFPEIHVGNTIEPSWSCARSFVLNAQVLHAKNEIVALTKLFVKIERAN